MNPPREDSNIVLKREPGTLVVSRGWVIFSGKDEGDPFYAEQEHVWLYVLYRDGMIIGPKRSVRFRWSHDGDALDVIAYIRADILDPNVFPIST